MKSVESIHKIASRCWHDGKLHRAHVLGYSLPPIEIPLTPPTGRKLADNFVEATKWATEIRELADCHRLKIEHHLVENRKVGHQKLPKRLVIESQEGLLSLLGTKKEFHRFIALCDRVLERHPALRELFANKPLWVMSFHDEWAAILEVLDFILGKNVSGLYLREVDLPGIDTKFISSHLPILDEVLRAALPEHKRHDAVSGLSGHAFAQRYGFKFERPLIRFRILKPAESEFYNDLSVPLDQFTSTPIDASTVFIVENKTNLLAFPEIPDAIAIWGQGYAVTRLSTVDWLRKRRIIYFGDIDTHGFTILDRLRKVFPQTRSMLMNRATLLAHRQSWVEEPKSKRQLSALERLTKDERALFDDLRQDRLGYGVRLEQEFVGFRFVESAARELAEGFGD